MKQSMVNIQPVKGSSNVAGIGYNPDQGLLAVRFHDGAMYHYLGVPIHIASAFRNAPSKGTFLNVNIRGHYPYLRVDTP